MGGILGIGIAVAGACALGYGAKQHDIRPAIGGFVVALLGVIMFGVSAARILGPAEVGVVTQLGRPVREITAGLNFVNPFTDGVTKMDYLVHGFSQTDEVYTKDGVAVTVESNVQYQLETGKATFMLLNFGTPQNAEAKMQPRLAQGIRNVCSTRSAMDMITDRGAFEADYAKATAELGNGLGLTVKSVTITNLALPQSLEDQLTAAQEAEGKYRELEQSKQNALLEVSKQNEIAVANAEAERKVAEKKKQAQILLGEGEAEYARLIGEAAQLAGGSQAYVTLKTLETQQAIAQMYTDKWNGNFPDTVMTAGGDGNAPTILFGVPSFATN